MRRLAPSQIAGLLSLLAALLVLGIWYVLLFVAQPEGIPVTEGAIATARYLLFEEDTSSHWFIWLAVLPIMSIVSGVCYLAGATRTKPVAIALLLLTVLIGSTSFFLLYWSLAFFVSLPAYWGYICVRQA